MATEQIFFTPQRTTMNLKLADIRTWRLGVKGTLGSLRDRQAKAKQRREDLSTLARTRDEAADLLCDHIDSVAALYPARLAACLHELIHKPLDSIHAEPNDEGTHPRIRVVTATTHPQVQPQVKTIEYALCYLFNAEIKVAVRKAIAEAPWPDAVGPQRAIRMQELGRLETDIADIDGQVKALEDEVRDALRDD
jgi:hypothetical protein